MYRFRSQGITKDRKIYGNWQVQSPDGILMFRCDEKKAKWYLDRDLGELVDSNVVRLSFQPKGLGNHNKDFGLSEMVNRCVVCGCEEFLTRHHVVPYCYRRYFPLELKSHNFHDVLLLCVECHEKYERSADNLKLLIANEYNVPINGEIEDRRDDVRFGKIATTLLGDCSSIPKDRINELKTKLRSNYNIKRITNKKLIEISNIKSTILKRTHGEMVIEKITDIQGFVEMWREHFIRNMNCQYLPSNWSIKSKFDG